MAMKQRNSITGLTNFLDSSGRGLRRILIFSVFLLFMLGSQNVVKGQEPVKAPDMRDELLNRFKNDQDIRNEVSKKVGNGGILPKDDEALWEKIDTENTARMKELINKHGWLGKSMVGEDGSHAAWILVQHADKDPKFQKKCLKLMEKAVKTKEASGKDFAYLTDRVLVREGKPQIYGTQMKFIDGKFGPAPIKDEKNVDERRASVGLVPLAEYVRKMKGEND